MALSRLNRFVVLCVVLMAGVGSADVELSPLFRDHMVLQQGGKVPVWGRAAPGEKVTVHVLKDKAETVADDAGRWRVALGPLQAGGPVEMVVVASNVIRITDVLIGEVWLCSGQSNMDWPVKRSRSADEEIAQADQPMIRLFGVDRAVAREPQENPIGTWSVCTPGSVKGFSAVAYFFARELRKKEKVPIGLIQASVGATPAEAWIGCSALERDADLKRIVTDWNASRSLKVKMSGQSVPAGSQPSQPAVDPDGPRKMPCGLFNGMIHPLIPYRIAGVIWYQGESNAWQADLYKKLFPALICDWRERWGQGDFPFLFVQLPNFGKRVNVPSDGQWARLREAQAAALELPRTGMVVTIDIGEADDIHPKNKQEVGVRLALTAEALVYGRQVSYTGPLFRSMKIEGDRAIVVFDCIGHVLATRDNAPVKGFAIAGDDRTFHWAEGTLENNTVVLRSDQVPKPVAVRYAWADNPDCNLVGVFQLPAGPFRTDDWPLEKTTTNKE